MCLICLCMQKMRYLKRQTTSLRQNIGKDRTDAKVIIIFLLNDA